MSFKNIWSKKKPIDGSSDPSYDPINNPGIIIKLRWKQSKVVDQTWPKSRNWPRFWSKIQNLTTENPDQANMLI
ncbi:hypothetical protein HYD83_00855 [Mycoplasmopsis bovis]|nr:hypothetical protein [Mycoplasmopsis bovis]QQH37272.1 hypothetical protein HYD83_00855 [Mycoplasmopsis bovis]